ncbi:MAG: hypothetical protein AAFV86_07310, partial [Pseudomonadota bacterium]
MTDLPLLTLILAIPAIGALILVAFLRGEDEAAALNAKRLGLLVTTFTFVLSLPLMTDFDPNDTGFQFVEGGVWFGGLSYKLGIDGISMPFVMLTTFFFPLVIAASWHVEHRVKEYIAAFLALEALIIGDDQREEEGRQHHEGHRDAVDAQLVAETAEPDPLLDELEPGVVRVEIRHQRQRQHKGEGRHQEAQALGVQRR